MVSVSDIGRAIENLAVRPRDHRSHILGTLGALLLGAALGNILQIAGAPQITFESALLTFVAGIVGAAMTALGFVRD